MQNPSKTKCEDMSTNKNDCGPRGASRAPTHITSFKFNLYVVLQILIFPVLYVSIVWANMLAG